MQMCPQGNLMLQSKLQPPPDTFRQSSTLLITVVLLWELHDNVILLVSTFLFLAKLSIRSHKSVVVVVVFYPRLLLRCCPTRSSCLFTHFSMKSNAPNTNNPILALESATHILLSMPMNPNLPSELLRTRLRNTKSFSSP